MTADASEIDRLARVFLTGFKIDSQADPHEVWQRLRSEAQALAKTLDEDDARQFEVAVRRLVDERGKDEEQPST